MMNNGPARRRLWLINPYSLPPTPKGGRTDGETTCEDSRVLHADARRCPGRPLSASPVHSTTERPVAGFPPSTTATFDRGEGSARKGLPDHPASGRPSRRPLRWEAVASGRPAPRRWDRWGRSHCGTTRGPDPPVGIPPPNRNPNPDSVFDPAEVGEPQFCQQRVGVQLGDRRPRRSCGWQLPAPDDRSSPDGFGHLPRHLGRRKRWPDHPSVREPVGILRCVVPAGRSGFGRTRQGVRVRGQHVRHQRQPPAVPPKHPGRWTVPGNLLLRGGGDHPFGPQPTPRPAAPAPGPPNVGRFGWANPRGRDRHGTHGCDFDRPPLADAVQAIYLIGAGGTHYWIERTAHITDPTKLQNIFPCLAPENINYDDTMFRAALVSMGSMGVVFAILLSVEDEYTLAQASRYGTWEQLLGPQPMGAGSDLSGAITGDWTGLIHWANGKYPAQEYPRGGSLFAPRALQVLINPIANDDGSHACIATARIEVPWQMSPSGPTSADFSQLGVLDLMSVFFHDPDCGVGADLELGPTVAWLAVEARPAGMEGELYQIGQLIGCCENNGYAWAVRALINFVLQSSYPEYDPHFLDKYPRVDIGHNIMAGGVFPGGFPQGGILSTESFFDLPTGLAFIGQLLSMLDSEVSDGHYPAGYVSLRLCGPSIATLGMQKDSPTACVEVAFLNTGNALEIIEKVEDLALSNSGRLHWGQMNGHLDAKIGR